MKLTTLFLPLLISASIAATLHYFLGGHWFFWVIAAWVSAVPITFLYVHVRNGADLKEKSDLKLDDS